MKSFSGLKADLVLLNGKIVTVDSKDTIAEAVAVLGDKIVSVGKSEAIKGLVGPKTKVIDLKGKMACPGFIETHCHPSLGGTRFLEVDLRSPPVKSIKDVRNKIKERVAQVKKGEWVLATNYNDIKLRERRHITRWELDEVASDNPVFISKETGHLYVVNSKALELAGITKDTPNPSGGKIDKDPDTGEPTGLLYEKASDAITKLIPPYTVEQIRDGLRLVFQQFLEWGLTSVHEVSASSDAIRAYIDLYSNGEMPVRVSFLARALTQTGDLLEKIVDTGFKSGFGDEWLRFMGIKLIIDGSGSGGSAAVYQPQHRGTKDKGILIVTPEKLKEQVIKAHKADLRVGIHAIGERGIDISLDAIEAALKEHSVLDMRHRIEHCSVSMPKQLERIKKLGVIPVSSIGYMWGIGDDYIENFGPERKRWLHPHRSYIDRGIIASGNSDWPVSTAEPAKQLYSAITRRTMTGQEFDDRERISRLEAIRTYTWNGAYSSKEEKVKGSIELGKLADIVVLDRDILTCPEEEIKDMKVLTTIVGGEIKYQRKA